MFPLHVFATKNTVICVWYLYRYICNSTTRPSCLCLNSQRRRSRRHQGRVNWLERNCFAIHMHSYIYTQNATWDPIHTIPAWNSAGRKSSRFQLFTRYRQFIFHFDNMLHKSVKIDRIKYPTTTFAVPLIHIIRETILLQYLLII
jgi:hypothetical protein